MVSTYLSLVIQRCYCELLAIIQETMSADGNSSFRAVWFTQVYDYCLYSWWKTSHPHIWLIHRLKRLVICRWRYLVAHSLWIWERCISVSAICQCIVIQNCAANCVVDMYGWSALNVTVICVWKRTGTVVLPSTQMNRLSELFEYMLLL